MLVVNVAPARLRGICLGASCCLRSDIRTASKAKVATVAARPFGQAGGARAHLPTGAAAYDGYLVGHRAEEVEDDIVQEGEDPGPYGQGCKQKLQRSG
jgi:hypothetical protein